MDYTEEKKRKKVRNNNKAIKLKIKRFIPEKSLQFRKLMKKDYKKGPFYNL